MCVLNMPKCHPEGGVKRGVESKPVSRNMHHADIEKDRNELLPGIDCGILVKFAT